METKELIRQGNVLIAAAREGKIGLSEDELKVCQKSYLKYRKIRNGLRLLKVINIVITICGFLLITMGSMLGYFMFFCGIFQVVNIVRIESRSKTYVEIVNREYPKLECREAA